jgi:hypothetical protein
VVLIALLLRIQFVQQAQVEVPMSGDSRHYVAYAINLVEHQTFSKAVPGEPVVADAYRTPGYPLFLAGCMRAMHGIADDDWYYLALWLQCLLGAATVWLTVLLAREWLPLGPSLAAGLLVAVWPHHVVASSALLSEVLLGFLLVLSLWLVARTHASRSRPLALAAGAALAAAAIVNPATLLLPLLLALAFIGPRRPLIVLVLALPLLCWAAWAWRGSQIPAEQGVGRGVLNFVQGSWPGMHSAWKFSRVDPNAAFTMAQIDFEAKVLHENPREGLELVLRRFSSSPGRYLGWYLFEKPILLWDWDVRVGAGGIYVNAISNSPFERNPVLRALSAMLRLANPVLLVLALAAIVQVGRRLLRGNADAATIVALSFAYFTLVHDVFQAEPRYAIAYRPEELLLAVSSLAWLGAAWKNWRARSTGPGRA